MSTILRAAGPAFDVDAFLPGCGLLIDRVYRRGEARFSRTKPGGTALETSGLTVLVSGAGLDDFAGQVRDATDFLSRHGAEVRRLVEVVGVDGVSLDFAIARRGEAAQVDGFPADLVRLAGACGIGLELSHYRVGQGGGA